MGHKNSEISSKSSEILVVIQQKIINDLFEKNAINDKMISINNLELMDIKEKILDFITEKEKSFLGRKTEKKLKQINIRYNLKRRERNEIKYRIDENMIFIKSSILEEVTLPQKELNSMNTQIILGSHDTKENYSKSVLKESNHIKKETDEKKLYAVSLNNNQLINLFSEILILNDPSNLTDLSLNKAVNDSYCALQIKNLYGNSYFDQKKFFTRKGICIQLRKIIKKIVKKK